jgi:hypothetical protein
MKTFSWLLLAVLLAGCGRSPEISKTDEFFMKWLKEHGETNVVADSSGIGLAGNKTRLHAALYGTEKSKTGCSVEVEFRIKLPEGGPIVEYVSGIGETQEKARAQAMVNFILTTAHVVYKAFMNPSDPHQRVKSVLINGRTRELFAGDMIQLGGGESGSIDLDSMSAQLQDLVAALPLGSGPHWIKLIYSQHHSQPVIVSASLDNKDSAEATEALNKLKWPTRDDFYMVKQFIVVK